ncbi:MAG TPA: sensor histidine kinase [Terriglobales bacterium]|nr:sensor histidine kinase [Terriglobales bacterium]
MQFDGLFLGFRNSYFMSLRPKFWEMRVRYEERRAERMRIARDLHDTVLQDFLSASMQLHMTVDQLPQGSPTKQRLSSALELMARVIDEVRQSIRGLRSPKSDTGDLEQAFSRIPQELAMSAQVDFRVQVLGSARPLNLEIHDHVYRIGREALINAFRHSKATCVEVELEYGSRRFRLIVRDNGCGINSQLLRSGSDGHWGLPGMRERAEQMGARLKIWSRLAAGTEVELTVPNRAAFASKRAA